ncbi:ABC transporter ATP-binding protein [Roseomonas sp. NAR14]|uniref:ABC transporter ATP-binding protein n=1 Tax=Roseomonas acroporae TaxID=2937791 RepID=A0A9X1Y7B0_9PROT|nr:ABC transporter ATP-binding protein [Roseomonas acroporae]MCK8784435.1 ABC transporter ATP-binding protein [Roseomonas acroporae]
MDAIPGRHPAPAAALGTEGPPLLRAEALTRRFGAATVLDGLDLEIRHGEFFALLGGSGSGKSTLLRLIAGFDAPDSGRLLLEGRDLAGLPPQHRPVNMMFQAYALFPHLSVFDNVAYGLRREGVRGAALARRVDEALALVGLEGLARRRPHALSGGQRQRVALARSLVKRPRLLLLDEPLGALDAGLRERTGFELRALQRRLAEAQGTAFVMVTHDQEEALSLADRVGVMQGGRLVQVDTPEALYERPATRFVAGFLGGANLLEGHVAGGLLRCAGGLALRLAGAPPPEGAPLTVALRPERIRLAAEAAAPAPGMATEPNAAAGTVREVAYRGAGSTVLVGLPGGASLRVALGPAEPPPPRGAAIRLRWPDSANVPLAD